MHRFTRRTNAAQQMSKQLLRRVGTAATAERLRNGKALTHYIRQVYTSMSFCAPLRRTRGRARNSLDCLNPGLPAAAARPGTRLTSWRTRIELADVTQQLLHERRFTTRGRRCSADHVNRVPSVLI